MGKSLSMVIAVLAFSGLFCSAICQTDSTVRVTEVVKIFSNKKPLEFGLNDYLQLKVNNLKLLYDTPDKKKEQLTLYFNGTPMRGILPERVDTLKGLAFYKIQRDSISQASWSYFYHPGSGLSKSVNVSVGLENQTFIQTDAAQMKLNLYNIPWIIVASLIVIGFVVLFIMLALTTSLLKDSNTPDTEANPPYSMAKSQLAFWTLLIASAFVFIWFSTGQIPVITGSTWILLAITIGTTAGAKIIDIGHNDNQNLAKGTKNWFTDVLNDGKSMSIHRFQMLVWTIIMGLYFIQQVIVNMTIPQFSSELLALMGISSGTYLGLRIPEDSVKATDSAKQESAPESVNNTPVG